MKKVIVFGGTGWLGHKVALNFANAGCGFTGQQKPGGLC